MKGDARVRAHVFVHSSEQRMTWPDYSYIYIKKSRIWRRCAANNCRALSWFRFQNV